MREETLKIYMFEELSDAAKEKAREWFRRSSDGDTLDFDCVIEDAMRMGEMMGIEYANHAVKLYGGGTRYDANIYWSGFCSQGDGASFEGNYSYKRGAYKALRAEAPAAWRDKDGAIHESKDNAELHRIARVLQQVQAAHSYQIVTRVMQSGRYYHENTMRFEHSLTHPRTGDTEDYFESGATEQIEKALRDFAVWVYAQLDSHNDYINSDYYIDDAIIANEYEFTDAGVRA